MKKLKEIVKNNYKLIIGLIIGIVLSGTGVYAATVINAINVGYSNTTSGLTSTNMQDALDEAYQNTELKNRSNIVEAYTYNSSTCVTGEEDTCSKTTCYKSTTAGSCPAGTIVRYKVSDTEVVTFHVMYDTGTTMTMQSQKNTIYNTPWMSSSDYAIYNTDSTSCSYDSCNDEGPMTALIALERATQSWTNVNDQTYTMGEDTFKTNAYTGCSTYNSCTTNTYTLSIRRLTKARMITVQEANYLGCTNAIGSCPIWMYNYLYNSTNKGGTANDNTYDIETRYYNSGYLTMSASTNDSYSGWYVSNMGYVTSNVPDEPFHGARAVVVVSK